MESGQNKSNFCLQTKKSGKKIDKRRKAMHSCLVVTGFDYRFYIIYVYKMKFLNPYSFWNLESCLFIHFYLQWNEHECKHFNKLAIRHNDHSLCMWRYIICMYAHIFRYLSDFRSVENLRQLHCRRVYTYLYLRMWYYQVYWIFGVSDEKNVALLLDFWECFPIKYPTA